MRSDKRPYRIQPEQVARESMQAIIHDRFDVLVGMVKALKIGSKVAPGLFFGIINKPEKRQVVKLIGAV